MDAMRRWPARLLLAAVVALAVWTPAPAARGAEPGPPANPWSHQLDDGSPVVDLWFGWSSGCPHCTRARAWLTGFAPTAPWLVVHSLQVDGPDADASVALLLALADRVGGRVDGVPAFLFAGRLETGFEDASTTGRQLERALADYHAGLVAAAASPPGPTPGSGPTPAPAPGPHAVPGTSITLPVVGALDARSLSLPLLAVVLGGLDAVNPCALSVLLFLVSALVGAGSRRRIALVGGAFVAVTGLVYLLLMAAWLNAFLWFGELRAVTLVAGAAAVGAGLINVKDFGWFGRGPSLVIPSSARPMIFGRLLDLSGTMALPTLLGTTILVAAVVSGYEMLCTGGFPMVFTRVLTLADLPTAVYYGYLLLYVSVYLAPLVAIVATFTVTLGTRGVSVDEARRLKLLSGLLMLGVGGLLLLAPDRLSDIGTTLGLFLAAGGLWLVALIAERLARGGSQVARSTHTGRGAPRARGARKAREDVRR